MKRRVVIETFEQRINREALETVRRAEQYARRRPGRRASTPVTATPAAKDEPNGYPCPELRPFTGRPGAMQAFALPSRVNHRLYHPDGRITGLQGEPLEA